MKWALNHKDDDFSNTVDIDEKWFFTVRTGGTLKLPPGINAPRQAVKSRRFISKLMVLTAITKPNHDYNFDGKIGVWAFAEEGIAKRSSCNRPRGAKVLVPYEVNGDKWADIMTNKVFRAIRMKMPWLKEVTVQYDNARPHAKKDIQARLQEAARNKHGEAGMEIKLAPQPVQSPDVNLNDLGFYASFDRAIGNRRKYELSSWWRQIQACFKEYPEAKLDKLVLIKRMILTEIVQCAGDNDYKLPHQRRIRKDDV